MMRSWFGIPGVDDVRRGCGWEMSARGNELVELYDVLTVVYRAVPPSAASEWRSALKSVVYGGELLAAEAACYGAQQKERNVGTREAYAQANGNGDRVEVIGVEIVM